MNNIDKGLSAGSAEKDSLANKVSGWVRDAFPYLILIADILVGAAFQLFKVDASNPFNADFFFSVTQSILTTMLTYSCFVAHGGAITRLTLPGYSDNIARWGDLSGKVRTGGTASDFAQYCRDRVIAEREERRQAIIENNTLIPYEVYLAEYHGKKRRDILAMVKVGKISVADAIAIRRANGKIRIKPINPLLILCGVTFNRINDAGRNNVNYTRRAIMTRPFMIFASSVILSMFHGVFTGWVNVFEIISSAITIIMSAVMGYDAGCSAIRKDNDRIKGRIVFLETYLEKFGKTH